MDLPKTTAFVSGANRGLGKHLADQLTGRGAGVQAGPASPEPLTPAPASSPSSCITDPASVQRRAPSRYHS